MIRRKPKNWLDVAVLVSAVLAASALGNILRFYFNVALYGLSPRGLPDLFRLSAIITVPIYAILTLIQMVLWISKN